MVTLARDANGNYKARKRLPDDVREEYGKRYGARFEAKFTAPANLKRTNAERLFHEWLAEVAYRIAAIRAERDGTGSALTPLEARKLAGEWYEWFIGHAADFDRASLEHRRDVVHAAFYFGAISDAELERAHLDDFFRDDPDVRAAVRPAIADAADTAQFLASKQLTLTNASRDLFLDFLYEDLAAALARLLRLLDGDYSHDSYPERFPKSVPGFDSGLTPWQLFEGWIAQRKPTQSTIESWRYVFQNLAEHFRGRSAASILPEEAEAWVKGLINPERSAATVKRTWHKAALSVFRWAIRQKHISRNPFEEIVIEVPRKRKLRERAFRPESRTQY